MNSQLACNTIPADRVLGVATSAHQVEGMDVQARRSGMDVRGYAHWSWIDNFEWAEGFGPRFNIAFWAWYLLISSAAHPLGMLLVSPAWRRFRFFPATRRPQQA